MHSIAKAHSEKQLTLSWCRSPDAKGRFHLTFICMVQIDRSLILEKVMIMKPIFSWWFYCILHPRSLDSLPTLSASFDDHIRSVQLKKTSEPSGDRLEEISDDVSVLHVTLYLLDKQQKSSRVRWWIVSTLQFCNLRYQVQSPSLHFSVLLPRDQETLAMMTGNLRKNWTDRN